MRQRRRQENAKWRALGQSNVDEVERRSSIMSWEQTKRALGLLFSSQFLLSGLTVGAIACTPLGVAWTAYQVVALWGICFCAWGTSLFAFRHRTRAFLAYKIWKLPIATWLSIFSFSIVVLRKLYRRFWGKKESDSVVASFVTWSVIVPSLYLIHYSRAELRECLRGIKKWRFWIFDLFTDAANVARDGDEKFDCESVVEDVTKVVESTTDGVEKALDRQERLQSHVRSCCSSDTPAAVRTNGRFTSCVVRFVKDGLPSSGLVAPQYHVRGDDINETWCHSCGLVCTDDEKCEYVPHDCRFNDDTAVRDDVQILTNMVVTRQGSDDPELIPHEHRARALRRFGGTIAFFAILAACIFFLAMWKRKLPSFILRKFGLVCKHAEGCDNSSVACGSHLHTCKMKCKHLPCCPERQPHQMMVDRKKARVCVQCGCKGVEGQKRFECVNGCLPVRVVAPCSSLVPVADAPTGVFVTFVDGKPEQLKQESVLLAIGAIVPLVTCFSNAYYGYQRLKLDKTKADDLEFLQRSQISFNLAQTHKLNSRTGFCSHRGPYCNDHGQCSLCCPFWDECMPSLAKTVVYGSEMKHTTDRLLDKIEQLANEQKKLQRVIADREIPVQKQQQMDEALAPPSEVVKESARRPVDGQTPAVKKKIYYDAKGDRCCPKHGRYLFYLSKKKTWKDAPWEDCKKKDCALSHEPASTVENKPVVSMEGAKKKKVETPSSFLSQTCAKWLRGTPCDEKVCKYNHVHMGICPKYDAIESCDGLCMKRHYCVRGGKGQRDVAFTAFLERLAGFPFVVKEGPPQQPLSAARGVSQISEYKKFARDQGRSLLRATAVQKARNQFSHKFRADVRAIKHSGNRRWDGKNAWIDTSAPDDDRVAYADEALTKSDRRNLLKDLFAAHGLGLDSHTAINKVLDKFGLGESEIDPNFLTQMVDTYIAGEKEFGEFIYDAYDENADWYGDVDPKVVDRWDSEWAKWANSSFGDLQLESLISTIPSVAPADIEKYLGYATATGGQWNRVNAMYMRFGNDNGFVVVYHLYAKNSSVDLVPEYTAPNVEIRFHEIDYKFKAEDGVRFADDLAFFKANIPNYSPAPVDPVIGVTEKVPVAMYYYNVKADGDLKIKHSIGKVQTLAANMLCPYDCSSDDGACSAGVWRLLPGKPKVCGFHTAQGGGMNWFIPLTQQLHGIMQQGLPLNRPTSLSL